MSAHARLATIAAAQAAMADLLRRVGMPDAPTEGKWYYSGRYVVCATVPICDEPVDLHPEVTRVVA